VADLILSNKINPKFARAKSSINSVNGYVSLTFKKNNTFCKRQVAFEREKWLEMQMENPQNKCVFWQKTCGNSVRVHIVILITLQHCKTLQHTAA